MADVGVAVVGAGVVGLAVAARLAPHAPDLVLIERNERHGQETSSRNSEVIHAGLYYPTGSLKARLCVEGNRMLYEQLARHGVGHRRIGKLVTATDDAELPQLERLLELGRANGAPLELLSGAQAVALEPAIRSRGAILSPSTGILSAHELMDHLLQAARRAGAVLQCRARVEAIERVADGYRLWLATPAGRESLVSEVVVNAAGLEADRVAELAGIDVDAAGYRQHWWKGSYFSAAAAKARLVSRLVYPVPGSVSLGVHAVLDLGGRLRFGPDAEHLPARRTDYHVDDSRAAAFGAAARRIVPAIEDADLAPDQAGIRAKLQGPGEGFRDFVIAEESERGLSGFVNLIGIDSPGLTSALAIARHVAGRLGH